MRRDRLTFGMMLGIPLLQLVLFGFAINSDPRHLPDRRAASPTTARTAAPSSRRSATAATSTSSARWTPRPRRTTLLARGEVQFVVTIPENFSRDLLRGDRPVVLVEADATDPAATSNAIGSLRALLDTALANDLKGPLALSAPARTRRWSCASTPATTPRRSRSTTSCPASWAWCSR